MRNLYIALILLIIAVGCEEYTPAEKVNLIANNLKKVPARTFSGCLVRYSLVSYYSRLSESIQRRAVENAFAIWQKSNPNMLYVATLDTSRVEISIKFVSRKQMNVDGEQADIGILKTSLLPLSQLKQVKGAHYEILLDESFNWDETTMLKTVGYQIGNYLGFPSSSDSNSIMYSITSSSPNGLSRDDSLVYNQLYPLPCKDMGINFLPLSLKLSAPVTQDIKLDKAGTVAIRSTGIITVGSFIGDCTPEGKFQFTYLGITFDIDTYTYNIEPTYPHGAVMYKINNEAKWRLCKGNCEFTTNGNEYITLTLQVNDKDVTDNIGVYDVQINYK
ncbi:matrixin family metalloprotease [Emticicia sp. 17c]|uniref:matrixin family metalloprotease n=1 Tax=Emticicia sp. 17c TaxID=3127704 RepID=UPI00301DC628